MKFMFYYVLKVKILYAIKLDFCVLKISTAKYRLQCRPFARHLRVYFKIKKYVTKHVVKSSF